MKKILIFILSLVMVFTLAACGGSSPDTTTTSNDTATEVTNDTAVEAPAVDSTTLTADQQTLVDEYNAMADRYNEVAVKFNADENLLTLTEVVDIANEVATSMEEMTTKLADAASLSSDDVIAYSDLIVKSNAFIDSLEALVNNYSGQTTVTIPITIQNNTGADLYTLGMSPANDNSWGGNLLTKALLDGESAFSSMTITTDTIVWDLMAGDSEGTPVEFYGIDFSDVDVEQGATLILYYDEASQSYMAGFDASGN